MANARLEGAVLAALLSIAPCERLERGGVRPDETRSAQNQRFPLMSDVSNRNRAWHRPCTNGEWDEWIHPHTRIRPMEEIRSCLAFEEGSGRSRSRSSHPSLSWVVSMKRRRARPAPAAARPSEPRRARRVRRAPRARPARRAPRRPARRRARRRAARAPPEAAVRARWGGEAPARPETAGRPPPGGAPRTTGPP